MNRKRVDKRGGRRQSQRININFEHAEQQWEMSLQAFFKDMVTTKQTLTLLLSYMNICFEVNQLEKFMIPFRQVSQNHRL